MEFLKHLALLLAGILFGAVCLLLTGTASLTITLPVAIFLALFFGLIFGFLIAASIANFTEDATKQCLFLPIGGALGLVGVVISIIVI